MNDFKKYLTDEYRDAVMASILYKGNSKCVLSKMFCRKNVLGNVLTETGLMNHDDLLALENDVKRSMELPKPSDFRCRK